MQLGSYVIVLHVKAMSDAE